MSRTLALLAAAGIVAGLTQAVGAQPPAKTPGSKGKTMTHHAAGTFEVKVQPLPEDEKVPGLKVARFAFDKQWKGDLEGTSKGEMMATNAGDKGSGGYVAVEQIDGRLSGHTGSFAVVHKGTMEGGSFDLVVEVVPGSGTGQLAGISGRITITIAGGKHSYAMDYALPD
jgi:Protein of unknown function (DUF3224)